jgi:hypothetical protein
MMLLLPTAKPPNSPQTSVSLQAQRTIRTIKGAVALTTPSKHFWRWAVLSLLAGTHGRSQLDARCNTHVHV